MFKTVNLSFIIRSSKARSDKQVPIYMRINVNGQIKEVSVGERILPNEWDSLKSQVRGRSSKAKRVNTALKTLEHQAREAHTKLLQERVEVTAKSVKERLTGKDKIKMATPVMTVFQEHNEKMSNQVGSRFSISTYNKY